MMGETENRAARKKLAVMLFNKIVAQTAMEWSDLRDVGVHMREPQRGSWHVWIDRMSTDASEVQCRN